MVVSRMHPAALGRREYSNLAAALGWLSSAHDALGDLASAYGARAENVEILSALAADDPSNTIWAQDKAVALTFNARLAPMLGDDEIALKSIDASCDILQRSLERDASNRVNQRALSRCGSRATEYMSQGDHVSALADAQTSIALIDSLIKAEGTQSDWGWLSASSRLRMAEIHADQRQCDRARADIVRMESILAPTEAAGYSKLHLARRRLVLGRCSRHDAELTESRGAFAAARDLIGGLPVSGSTLMLVYWTLALIELNDTPAVNDALKLLKSRGYRGSTIRRACLASNRGDYLS